MKLIITQLDNGYTLTVVSQERVRGLNGEPGLPEVYEERKQRLVFETKEGLNEKLRELNIIP